MKDLIYADETYAESTDVSGMTTYRRPVVISPEIAAGNPILQNFEFIFEFEDTGLMSEEFGGHVTNSDGSDIRFSDASGQQFFTSLISSYNPETGYLLARVLLDSLPVNSGDYTIYLNYGGQAGSYSVSFPFGFEGAWCFDLDIADHSLNQLTQTSYTSNLQNGIVSNALKFNGNNQYLHVDQSAALNPGAEGSVMAWINMDVYKSYGGIVHYGDLKSFRDEAYSLQLWSNNNVMFGINTSSGIKAIEAGPVVKNTWYHLAGVWSADSLFLYINGELKASTSHDGLLSANSAGVNIGSQLNENFDISYRNFPFKGKIDEVRILSYAVDPVYVMNIFASAGDPPSYYSVGQEEYTGSLLPVELGKLVAVREGSSVFVKWFTWSEQNNKSFTVEESTDGISYSQLAEVPGSGTTNERRDYSVCDHDPSPGTIYYRMIQKDYNGATSKYGPVVVAAQADLAGKMKDAGVYPNPFREGLTVRYQRENAGNTKITIQDMTGRIVVETETPNEKGQNEIEMMGIGENLQSGMYVLTVTDLNQPL
ncbi:MAG: T9SS type A sorting domain-containing protein, partial [Bacteroidetes bacterium]|nr:T9SS type A sorting domain-containing protein [Bacteroidota bacterium]MBU1718259.1 T9SS type A sorting domain-containing protein [Bacteroidota bacterium]